ncbi:heterokaryon incompatibility protein-domain-containing protein, partial [Lasiosphaeris hirsuta]
MTPATFKYHSSPQDGEIRLLRVEPGSENEPVRCSLSIGKLQRGGYEALSYCWGTKPANRHILCDNQQFPVTENLLMALTRFRNTEQPRTLWIDAICINQTDLDEKSQQVAFMPSIYRKCTRVLVWLGEGD